MYLFEKKELPKSSTHSIHFPEYDVEFSGERGTMIIFPSEVEHEVKEQLTDNERVTIAFNIIHKDDLCFGNINKST